VSRVHIRFDKHGDVTEYELRSTPDGQQAEYERGFKAMMIAPRLEVCRALLRGEKVPLSSLDPEAVERFWRRER
jgi:hypothetical protein